MHIGMRGDQRRITQGGHIPKALLIEMRQIQHNAEFIAALDQPPAGIGESRASIRR